MEIATDMSMKGTTGLQRTVPWGTVKYISASRTSEHFHNASTTLEAMRNGGLDWTVTLEPAFQAYFDEDGAGYRTIDKNFVVTRSTDQKALGVVGERYTPIFNRRLAELTDTMIDTSEAKIAGMGETDGGRRVFTVVKLGEDQHPGGLASEGLGSYLINYTSHDGTSAFGSVVIVIRWMCVNGLIGVLPKTAHHYKIRHTRSSHYKLQYVQKIMADATGYLNQVTTLAEIMLNIELDRGSGRELIDELIPVPDLKPNRSNQRGVTIARQARAGLEQQWIRSPTLEEIRWSGWGLMNAVSEFYQHGRGRRKGGRDDMTRLVHDSWDSRANRARDLILAAS
jgi:phage/plasmid-like protein (TIGR03299 family)